MQELSPASSAPVIVLVGGSGFVGSALGERFAYLGWHVRLVTRSLRPFFFSFPAAQYRWDGKTLDPEVLEGADAIINLAGQPIFEHRWTHSYKNLIIESRRNAGNAILLAMQQTQNKPGVMIQLSGTDYYGMEPRSNVCNESTSAGQDFMAQVGLAGEEPVLPLSGQTRFCIARMGLVLGWTGGGLAQLWDVYASGCGGQLGGGAQWMNWVHLNDVVEFCVTAVTNEHYSGVYNLVAPDNATNKQLHKKLCEYTRSFKHLRAPHLYLKLLMGQQGNFLLQAPRVTTPRAMQHGFTYQFPNLDAAFANLISPRLDPSAHFICAKQWVPLPPARWNAKHVLPAISPRPLYKKWSHQQLITPWANGSLFEDQIEYKLPFFPLGQFLLSPIRKRIFNLLSQRRRILAQYSAQSAS